MVKGLNYALQRLLIFVALSLGATALVFCTLGPVRPQAESTTTPCVEATWGEEISTDDHLQAQSSITATASPSPTLPASRPLEAATSVRGRVVEDPTGQSLESFFESLAAVEQAESGVISRISCFGDSHTAADLMTGQLRRRMQGRFGDGGHGFIAAGRPWPSYRHRNISNGSRGVWETHRVRHNARADEVDGLFGLAGVAIETDRPDAQAWVATDPDGPVGQRASRFELYYLNQPRGGRIALQLDGEEVARISSRAPDNGAGYFVVEAEDGAHELRVESQGRGMVRLFGVSVEREGPGVTVDSLGINGARVTAMLAWDEDLFAQNLAHRGPDLVVLWYGANSVGDEWYDLEQYQQWYLDALTRVRRAAPEASCLLVGPPDMARATLAHRGPAGTPPALKSLIDVQRDVAGLVGCGFFDTFEAMGGQDSNLRWAQMEPARVSGDGIHFTIAGYSAIADLLYDALIDSYERYLEAHPGE